MVTTALATAGSPAGLARRPLTLRGRRIGTLLVRFTGQGLVASANSLRASLVRAVIGAAGLAALLAS